MPWSDSSVPSGFLECNGQAVSQSTYADLFAIIGTTYGDPGGGNFSVPDLQDNVPVGKSGTKSLASTGGANTVTSTGNVGGSTANATLSTAQLASHAHNLPGPFNNPGTQNANSPMLGGPATVNPGTVPTTSTGSGQGHSHNMSATFSGDATTGRTYMEK